MFSDWMEKGLREVSGETTLLDGPASPGVPFPDYHRCRLSTLPDSGSRMSGFFDLGRLWSSNLHLGGITSVLYSGVGEVVNLPLNTLWDSSLGSVRHGSEDRCL